jgi:hypothetical protein
MTYSGYADKQKRKKYLKEFMRQKRAREREIQKHAEDAIMEVLKHTTIIKQLEKLHNIEGNWKEHKNQPVALLLEELISLLRNPIQFTLQRDPTQTKKITDFLLEILNKFSRSTLIAKINVAHEISQYISTYSITSHSFTSNVDKLLTDWIYWLLYYVKGGFEGHHNEYQARVKLIDAWREMWNLEPIKRS